MTPDSIKTASVIRYSSYCFTKHLLSAVWTYESYHDRSTLVNA